MTATTAPLGEVLIDAQPGFASGDDLDDGIFQIRMNNLTREGGLRLEKRRRVSPVHKQVARSVLRPGDVLFNTTNSPELVGKTAYFEGCDEPAVYSNHFLRLRTRPDVLDARFLTRCLQREFDRGYFRARCKQWVNQATFGKDRLEAMPIPLPPIEEQRRIAALLDAADALRAKRRQALAKLDTLTQAIFIDMFGDPVSNPMGWRADRVLADVADVRSGITKGRKTGSAPLTNVPFLAVVNVQDGFIVLDPLKTIEATESEVAKFALADGDILLTEGGDPDKLGRGAVWRGQVSPCVHQNHVFRVRVTEGSIVPDFLSRLLGSVRGKRYFLRMAKQTTGIASINMSQLKAFPLLEPPVELQLEFLDRVARVAREKQRTERSAERLDELFASLQQRAFRGEL